MFKKYLPMIKKYLKELFYPRRNIRMREQRWMFLSTKYMKSTLNKTDTEKVKEQLNLLKKEIDDNEALKDENNINHNQDQYDEWVRSDDRLRKLFQFEAYLIELTKEEELTERFQRYLVEAIPVLNDDIIAHYKNYWGELKGKENADELKRKSLLELLGEIHMSKAELADKRKISKLIRLRVGLVFGVSCLFFFLSILIFLPFMPILVSDSSVTQSLGIGTVAFFSMVSGFFGASFSILIGLKKRLADPNLEELMVQQRWEVILVRTFIGAGAGLALLFIFGSGLITEILNTDIFPSFDLKSPNIDLKTSFSIIAWCVLGGFSEKLVPNTLEKLSTKLDSKLSTKGTPG